MSWNFEFFVENKAAARHQLEVGGASYAPSIVKELILQGIDGVKDDGVLHIKSHGHIATPDSAQITDVHIQITRIHIAPVST
jgi:hypothetical protein